MNKTLLATLIGSSILLAGCNESTDDTDSDDVDSPIVKFAPFADEPELSTPNDLVMDTTYTSNYFHRLTGSFSTTDRTNITEDEYSASADVYYSTSQLDGWGLGSPFTIEIELPDSDIHQTELDADSIEQDGVVYIYKCGKGESMMFSAISPCTSYTALTYGVDYELSADDDGIIVTPLKPFDSNTGYLLGVTNLAKDSFGQALTRSSDFDDYSNGEGAVDSLNDLITGTNTVIATYASIDEADIMYSATWSTQDVESTAKAVMAKIITDNELLDNFAYVGTLRESLASTLGVTFDDANADDATSILITENTLVFSADLDIPYFLPYPGVEAYSNEGLNCPYGDICGNWLNADGRSPGQEGFFANNSFTPVESTDHSLAMFGFTPNVVKVQLTFPTNNLIDTLNLGGSNITEIKVSQYVHGITSIKETGLLIAPALSAAGIATISIDQPLHGDRSADFNFDGVYDITATDTSYGDAYANGNSAVFANLSSLLTARDNLRQAASDQLALKYAIEKTDIDAALAAEILAEGLDMGDDNINETSTSLVGVSLGSMVGTVAQGMSEIYEATNDVFIFDSSALTVGGAQIGPIMGYSETFGPTVKEALVATTGFSGGVADSLGYTTTEALILQAASGDTYGTAAQAAVGMTAAQAQAYLGGTEAQAAAEFQAMIDLGYSGFLSAFINGAQVVIDSGDSLIWSTKTTTTPTLATQVIGNGSTNLSDQTVPNDVIDDGFPISGTLGWLEALDLTQKSTDSFDANGLRVYTNYLVGKHTSALDSTHEEGVTESASAAASATSEMQTEIATFLYSSGTTLAIDDDAGTVIE